MKGKKIFKLNLLIFISFMLLNLISLGHGGRLDGNGGHYNRETGHYHYHDGRDNGSGWVGFIIFLSVVTFFVHISAKKPRR